MSDPEWLTKAEAANHLNTSTRTIERLVRAGKIETRKKPRPHKSPETLCRAQDVEALQTGGFLLPAAAAPAIRETAPALAAATLQAQSADALLAFLEKLATIATPATKAVPAPDQPWLRVDEAAARSGLSRRFIRQLIESGDIIAIKDGRAWKVSQESLRTWTPKKNVSAASS